MKITKKLLKISKSSMGIIKVSDIKSEAFIGDSKFELFSNELKSRYKVSEVDYFHSLNMEVKKVY